MLIELGPDERRLTALQVGDPALALLQTIRRKAGGSILSLENPWRRIRKAAKLERIQSNRSHIGGDEARLAFCQSEGVEGAGDRLPESGTVRTAALSLAKAISMGLKSGE